MIALLPFLLVSLLVTVGISLFYPAPTESDVSIKKSILMMAPAIILMLGAIWYFLASLRTFKPGLRPAYILLSIGIFLLPIPTALIVLVLSFPDIFLSHIEVIRYIIIASFIVAATMMYAGTVLFARLLAVKHLLVKSITVFVLAVVAAMISLKFMKGIDVQVAKLGLQSLAASTVIALGTALFAIRIKKTLGAIYTSAMNWLIAAFIVLTFDYATNVILSLWPEKFLSYLDYSDWPLVLMGITFLAAGYLFWRSGRMAKISDTATYVDSVTHIAQMVSDPKSIDPTLDKMRVITAKRRDNDDLTSSEKKELTEVYLKIEEHLVHHDPLRKISKSDLRASLSYDFQQVLSEYGPARKTSAKV
jgi:hypothetical protein